MVQYVRVADAGSIEPGSAHAFSVGRYEVAVFNVDGEFYALENACPHQGGPIADGFVEGAQVTCPWHAWCFDVRTGKMTLGDFATIPQFVVRVESGGLFISTEPMDELP
jgi:nitrite reductase (NADH) small subunit/3-phenylpropionate/trans-cinnamate dioxygenase ferredoxin subunit